MHGKVLSVSEPKGPLVERLKKADADSDIIIALAPEAFPNLDKMIEEAKKGVPPLVMDYLDAAKTVRGRNGDLQSRPPPRCSRRIRYQGCRGGRQCRRLAPASPENGRRRPGLRQAEHAQRDARPRSARS